MDKKSVGLSDKQTILEHRSRDAFNESMAQSTEPPQQKTEFQRREYNQARSASAIKRDDDSPLQSFLPRRMEYLDMKYGYKVDRELRENMTQVSASQSRLLEMDKKSADFSDKQTMMGDRSKFPFYESIAKSIEQPQQKTEFQRREYHQAQAASAIKRDVESPLQSLSPITMNYLDMKYGNEGNRELREKMTASQSRLLEMDKKSADFSDKQTMMEHRSKFPFNESMAKSIEQPQQKTEFQRREYHQAQAASDIKRYDECTLQSISPRRRKSLDIKSGSECENEVREEMVHVSASQGRLLEMDNKTAVFSDKQTNMEHRSKIAFYESMAKSTEQPQQKTENQKREYHQAQAASDITRDDECPVQSFSPRRMKALDTKSSNECNNELREKMVQVSASQSRRWSPNEMEIFQHPMCLISAVNEIGEETKILLKSEEKVFDQIAKIDWPMVVVAVAGLYRTGKSYLMNRLANSNKADSGFALGDTIESTTKGIWAWCKIHPTRLNTVLLLLDTEGLGDIEKGDPRYDNRIFTLATLLCNCLVYNMKGAFDNDAVSKLTFVTEMASNIRFRGKSSEDNKLINLILPDFVLCLRDFSLKLIKDGKKITENDYLEQGLAENKSKADQFNKPRECIRKYFKRRECFAFPVPGDGDVLENLETLSFTQLSKRFKEVTTRFISYIYSIPPKSLLDSKPINGQMFVTLADRYVTAIKNGAVPDVDDAFTAVAKIENARVEKEALDIFKTKMETVTMPISESNLRTSYTNAQNKALHHLRQNVVHDFQAECEIEAQRKMDAIWNQMKTTNETIVREKCENILQKVFVKYLKKNIENREYEAAGGHRKFKRDVQRTKDEYVTVLRDFKENEIISTWYGFVEGMSKTEAEIIEADENLSQMEKEAEQRRNQEKLDELLKQQQRAYDDALYRQKQCLANHYEKLDNDRREKQAADHERYEEMIKERLEKEEALQEVERSKLAQKAAEEKAACYKKKQEVALEQNARYKKENEKRKNMGFFKRLWKAIKN